MAKVFWDADAVTRVDFLETGTMVSSAIHCNARNFETAFNRDSKEQAESFCAT
jgi:hypothetical protein